MKKYFLLSVLTLAAMMLSLSANAASEEAVTNWAGPYAGIHFGGAVGEFTNAAGITGPTQTATSVVGGIQGGYNWQRGPYVFGGEADISGIPLNAKGSSGTYDEQWMMTFRARAGYAIGKFLPYATIGLAVTNTESTISSGASASDLHAGLAAGAGVEHNCFGNWFLRGEYLYANAPNETSTINGTTFTGGSANHLFRVALNYHFN